MRILVDCSYIDFNKQPTGIPRVVANYIEEGYKWYEKSGVEVLPVVCTKKGVFAVRPVPVNFPSYIKKYAPNPKFVRKLAEILKVILEYGGNYASGIIHHVIYLIYAIFRIKRFRFIFERIDSWFQNISFSLASIVGVWLDKTALLDVNKNDIIFCPAYWHDIDPDIFKELNKISAGVIILIHDVLPITHEKYYAAPWRYMFKDNVQLAMRNASAIVAVSQTTAKELKKTFPEEAKKVCVSVAYNGFQNLNKSSKLIKSSKERLVTVFEDNLPPYIVVGSIEPKKRHDLILDALLDLWNTNRNFQRKLVIIGRPGWLCGSIVARMSSNELEDLVVWYEDLNDEDLCYCYYHCYALIFASIAEGFGLPMLEAAMASKPIIVNRSEISNEILGDYGVYFDGNITSLKNAILYLEKTENYQMQISKMENYRWPSWNETVGSVFDNLIKHSNNLSKLPRILSNPVTI